MEKSEKKMDDSAKRDILRKAYCVKRNSVGGVLRAASFPRAVGGNPVVCLRNITDHQFFSLLNASGDNPTSRRNTRLKYPLSEKPTASAMSVMLCAVFLSSCLA